MESYTYRRRYLYLVLPQQSSCHMYKNFRSEFRKKVLFRIQWKQNSIYFPYVLFKNRVSIDSFSFTTNNSTH